jgi:Na+-transporting NADH:ubiquinone oxidoreductase subunit NqrD
MNSILSTMISMVSIIAPCIVFGVCCYFLSKKTVVEAILMTTGAGMGLIIHLLYFLMPILTSYKNMPYTEVSKYYTVIGIFNLIASLCFAIGFLILVFNTVKKSTAFNDQFPKSND